MKSGFHIAAKQLAAERGLPLEKVIAAVEAALVSAYKRDNLVTGQDMRVRLNPNTGDIRAFILKTAVEAVTDQRKEMTLAEARSCKADVQLGDVVEVETQLAPAGRIAAQTARQVVLQRLREAERELVFGEYANRVGDIIAGRVERIEPSQVLVNLGRAEGIMPREEQVPTERYRPNQTYQFYLVEVQRTPRGPEIVLSRSHRDLVKRLFEREVPEIYNGLVEIKAIAREPGSRSKVAVAARQEGLDPVGSCVGLRGFRIQNIVNELQGEKIDVVKWDRSPATFIANALSPAQVLHVVLVAGGQSATVVVPDKQLSLAIGKEGQNARLAARLTGSRVDIKSLSEHEAMKAAKEAAAAVPVAADKVVVAQEAPPEEAPVPREVAVPAVAQAAATPLPPAVQEALPPEPAPVVEAARAPEPVAAEVQAPAPAEVEPSVPERPPAEVQEVQTEEVGIPVDSEEVWTIPVIPKEPSVLRFAEDIMPERGKARRADAGRSTETKAKQKKGKRVRVRAEGADQEADH
jgi:N utilization substance protein A